jgi:hypothetical protein
MRLHWLAIAACIALGACVPYPYYDGGYYGDYGNGYGRPYRYSPYRYAPPPAYPYAYPAP